MCAIFNRFENTNNCNSYELNYLLLIYSTSNKYIASDKNNNALIGDINPW